jgi:DNA modification methylase
MKPVELMEYQLGNNTNAGDIVLDLFGGSGSTLIACEKTARACRMVELDPKYVDVIVKRWQDYSGEKATLQATGQTFEEVKDARA